MTSIAWIYLVFSGGLVWDTLLADSMNSAWFLSCILVEMCHYCTANTRSLPLPKALIGKMLLV